MKIAVPTRDGRVDDHFGHCAYYTIFDVIDGKVTNVSKMASPEGCGCPSCSYIEYIIGPILSRLYKTIGFDWSIRNTQVIYYDGMVPFSKLLLQISY